MVLTKHVFVSSSFYVLQNGLLTLFAHTGKHFSHFLNEKYPAKNSANIRTRQNSFKRYFLNLNFLQLDITKKFHFHSFIHSLEIFIDRNIFLILVIYLWSYRIINNFENIFERIMFNNNFH